MAPQGSSELAKTVVIDGVTYIVVREKEFTLGAREGFAKQVTRTALTLKRPRGKRFYEAVRYENGRLSSAI